MSFKLATAVACSFGLLSTPAFAGEPGYVPSATVTFSDLNLSTPEGQAELERRIDTAARAMCDVDRISTGTRIKSRAAKQCYKTALKSTKEQVSAKIAETQRGG